MRTFESSKIPASPSIEVENPSGQRFANPGVLPTPPGFGELGMSKASKSFSTFRRKERVSRNLRLTLTYLRRQLDGLSGIQSTLMLWMNSKTGGDDQVGVQKIFMQPIENILNFSYHNIPLYGDGTEDPMKLHYLNNGTRDFLEVEVVPLLSQPSISSLRIAFAQDLVVPISLLESSGGEVMNQRLYVGSKLQKVDELSKDLSNGCKEGVPLGTNNSTSSNILFNFFRRAFGVHRSASSRIRTEESYLPHSGQLTASNKNGQL